MEAYKILILDTSRQIPLCDLFPVELQDTMANLLKITTFTFIIEVSHGTSFERTIKRHNSRKRSIVPRRSILQLCFIS